MNLGQSPSRGLIITTHNVTTFTAFGPLEVSCYSETCWIVKLARKRVLWAETWCFAGKLCRRIDRRYRRVDGRTRTTRRRLGRQGFLESFSDRTRQPLIGTLFIRECEKWSEEQVEEELNTASLLSPRWDIQDLRQAIYKSVREILRTYESHEKVKNQNNSKYHQPYYWVVVLSQRKGNLLRLAFTLSASSKS